MESRVKEFLPGTTLDFEEQSADSNIGWPARVIEWAKNESKFF